MLIVMDIFLQRIMLLNGNNSAYDKISYLYHKILFDILFNI